ncbi:MAG: hypothetical protein HONDAALG_01562 [Gammaproteobacteria bacterium]|nr:hypothetical protein [Gammaproteobacteria bacterium]
MTFPYGIGSRFTGKCVCGMRVEPAYNAEKGFLFWNCFQCFPHFTRATGPIRRQFLKSFQEYMDKVGDQYAVWYAEQLLEEDPI